MDLSFLFSPIASNPYLADHEEEQKLYLGQAVNAYLTHFPDWSDADIVIFGCNEYRGNLRIQETAIAADRVREFLYSLSLPNPRTKVADLGNLILKEELDQTYDAITYVTETLLRQGKTVILIGGSQDLTYAQYRSFEEIEESLEYTVIDSMPDILDSEIVLSNRSYNHKIITHAPNYLDTVNFLGFQGYFITEPERKALKALNFEYLRVSELRENPRLAEPFLRTSHLISFDMAAIRHSEAPATHYPSPAGFTIEEACGLARFAGMGYQANAINFTEIYSSADTANQTAHCAALLTWFFIEGFYGRLNDFPLPDRANLQKFRVAMSSGSIKEIVFYQSPISERWWMEVPSPDTLRKKGRRSLLVSCSVADYEQAKHDDVPERWWKTHYKLAY